jgi:hypothetical protein
MENKYFMSTFPGSPKILKGGIVLVDPDTLAVQCIIVLQYNPDTISRTLQAQAVSEGGDRSEALRLKGPPVETIKLDAEIDATDQMELGDQDTAQYGIHPQLSALETMIYPKSSDLIDNNRLANQGKLEIAPTMAPLSLFVWSEKRIIPVRVTDFSVMEEAFDPSLNPIRAKVSLGMRVLNINDIGFDTNGGSLYMNYQQQKERMAEMSKKGVLGMLGIGGIQ